VAFPHSVLNSTLFLAMSPHASKLPFDVAAQYRGDSNGDLSAVWKIMQQRGWLIEATLPKAKHQLLDTGFRYEARKTHRPNVCSPFAVTWFTLDDNEKFDAGAKTRFVRGEFRLVQARPEAARCAAGHRLCRLTLDQQPDRRSYGSIGITASAGSLRLNSSTNGTPMTKRVPLDRTPCNFGGTRAWLCCPRCSRRVGVL
jgi:hypothetical protein